MTAGRLLITVSCLVSHACASHRPSDAAAPPPPPPVVTYRPFTAGYESVTHGRVDQEFNRQVTTSTFVMRIHVTARVDTTATGLEVRFTLDSLVELDGQAIGFSQTEAAAVTGTVFRGTLTPAGEVVDLQGGDTTSTFVRQLNRRVKEFLPRIPADGVRPGALWTDTTESTTLSNGLDLSVSSVNVHEARGWTPYAGAAAFHIVTRSTYTVSGSGEQGGQEIVLAGTGTRHRHEYLDGTGRYVGMTAADTANLSATVPTVGAVIPITQVQVDTLTLRTQ